MTLLPSLPITIPLAGAVLCMLFRRSIAVQKAIAFCTSAIILLTSLCIMAHTKNGTIAVMNVGSWQAPFGITLAIDMLSSVMLVLVGLLAVGVSAYACFDLDRPRMQLGFFPLMLILLMGVNGAFVTGDLFNLYVWFEVLLTASFILLALGGERQQLEGSIKYVALNLLSSALFLAGIGILYGMAGTLNMAELAHLVQEGGRGGLVTMVAVMFMMAFGIKCGMFPLYFWLPASYPTPPAAVTALFSGLLTKVGVYSLIRVFTLIFDTDPDFLHGMILAGAGLTMLSGVLAAAAQYEMRKILAVHIVSQIGYIVMGLGLFTKLALTGTIVYLIHVIIVKTNLFLVAGAINRIKGTYDLHKLGGLYKEKPGLSILFIISAMSLAGVPPLSGFFAKLTLIIAGLRAESWLIVVVALGVSLLTLYSMTKIWTYVFWKPAPEPLPDLDPMSKGKWFVFLLPMIGYTILTIAIGVFAGPIFDYADAAAGQLMNPQGYIDAVLGGAK
ncbi:Na(+)/H(+) antiporter subunit D [Pontiella desulfatans]|uniref:Na(+)/H(+) antiporter subunit D n=1 Tax=Pontiella desulfatans TaxID=2750659 RepID=A0A6C2UB01_PONDE|nr:proton-conducting transporter membrane subunit [Pontiella desulfatans]VGO17332.1 Na(+)/H(+) antiporter subunit D [Pontiella desulfatans]